jgi:Cu2+-exporting ATPase
METCYHCGGELPQPTLHFSELGGKRRAFCCAGCQAIAETIHGQGLQAFYARRIPLGSKPDEFSANVPDRLLAYDDPVLTSRFVQTKADGLSEVTLRLEKIRCAACVWLNEQHLLRVPGVQSAIANYVTQRAVIRFDPARCKLSTLLFAVEQIGYAAWPFEPSASNDMARRERRQLLMRLSVASLGMMQVMMYAWPTYTGATDLLDEHASLLGWASWLLTLPVIFYSAAPMFSSAFNSVRHFARSRALSMDVPVALALATAFAAGTINLVHGLRETYFDSMTMFVAFLLAARYVELRARQDAQSGAEALARQLPATCERFKSYPESQDVETIPVVRCEVGDVLRVSPGEAIPADGVVLSGASAVDEALLSGESRAVRKNVTDVLYAGSHNLESLLIIRITAVGQATRLAGIASLLDQALQAKPQMAGLAERWAGYFVAVLLVMALMTGLVWWWLDSPRAWINAVAVLVVSCPCALSLATPAALAAAQGAVTRLGLLVVRGHALETMAAATDLVLDKTGTVTTGQLQVTRLDICREGFSREQALALVAALEAGQRHPVGVALLAEVEKEGIRPALLGATPQGVVGKGVQADGWQLGSAAWLGMQPMAAEPGTTLVALGDAQGVAAVFELSDTPRPGAQALVDAAHKAGIRVHLLSGDDPLTVAWWAQKMGIEYYRGGALPEEKHAVIRALQDEGRVVWAVGDGINDAPQLAQANVSVAVGSGAPLAQAGADAVLTAESLTPLAAAIRHARRTNTIIRQNLAWAFVYNVVAIPMAAFGLVNPWVAGVGMALSSLGVTLNAWRLRKVT